MDNAGKFIEAYNKIASHLRSIIQADSNVTFSQLIRTSCERHILSRDVANRMQDYGDLRNAIVHHRAYPSKIIAQPTTETLDEFNRDIDSILSPVRLIPAFGREVRLFTPEEPLSDVLCYMGKHDFSQIVIQLDRELSVLTVEGIAKWLEAQVVDDIISVKEAKVLVLRHRGCDWVEAC